MSFFEKFLELLNDGLLSRIEVKSPGTLIIVFVLGVIAVSAVAYLLGSINTAVIISKIFYRDDVRNYGSGNAGATNMLRTYGLAAAAGTLIGDALKAVLAVLAGELLMARAPGGYIAMLACIIGHVYPIYYKFKGGKGVICVGAAMAVLSPYVFLICLGIFLSVVFITKYISLASMVASLAYPLILSRMFPGGHVIFAFLAAIFIIFCHRANIKRIKNHTEPKVSFKRKKKD